MCGVCGCGKPDGAEHEHALADGAVVRHSHGEGAEHAHVHGHAHEDEAARRVKVERDILSRNDEQAARNRRRFEQSGTFVVNLMSGPGSGKTTLLVRTLKELGRRLPLAVIEGDQQTTIDADRIRDTGVPALQVNTGKGCHLDATMIDRALTTLPAPKGGVLFVENVGNLVCPAGFDLGEAQKVVVISVTEGEDKPLKYPDMFAAADLVLVNKADLLPHLDFEVGALERNLRRVNHDVQVLIVSARTGEGFAAWLGWLEAHRPKAAGEVRA
ncbi:MAG: hydrogenase nickel incorporation protein HypB [Myxococcales bacterium]|nr:hydrogenase nickel incorporation protein HypB [Myxococcales bacterium]